MKLSFTFLSPLFLKFTNRTNLISSCGRPRGPASSSCISVVFSRQQVEDTRGYAGHRRVIRGLYECQSKCRGCRDRPTLFRARDIFPSSHPQRAVHHDISNGDQSARQRFGLHKGKELGRPSLYTGLDSVAELGA